MKVGCAMRPSRRPALLRTIEHAVGGDAHFLLGLQKAGVKFVAADMPEANEMVVGIMALVAQDGATLARGQVAKSYAGYRTK